jgi:hypothetical protein
VLFNLSNEVNTAVTKLSCDAPSKLFLEPIAQLPRHHASCRLERCLVAGAEVDRTAALFPFSGLSLGLPFEGTYKEFNVICTAFPDSERALAAVPTLGA